MNWNQLLSIKRTGLEHRPLENDQDRTQFQRDYDRLIFSSPFRRLQDKTQVFALPGSTFVHNRLTHSLEVSSVGRSLGNNIGRWLKEQKYTNSELAEEIGSAVAAACLAHDMGNPPFGHSGEEAISHYFIKGKGKTLQTQMSVDEWSDLTSFEGNANAFRMLTHQLNGRRKGGFSMTYTTVASILKYPYKSGLDLKKYGFFQSEKSTFLTIVKELGMVEKEPGVYARHPLVYLVEAADDICYLLMDIEDAHKLKILSTEKVIELFSAFFINTSEIERITEVCTEVSDTNEQISFLRAMVIGKLIGECTQIFKANHDNLLSGNYPKALIDDLPGHYGSAMKQCREISIEKIYHHPSVVEIEIAGYKILGTLLEEFIDAVLSPKDFYSKKLLPFIPEQFTITDSATTYEKVQSVLDFVSSMTDVYALDLYRKLQGTGLSDKGM